MDWTVPTAAPVTPSAITRLFTPYCHLHRHGPTVALPRLHFQPGRRRFRDLVTATEAAAGRGGGPAMLPARDAGDTCSQMLVWSHESG